MDRKHLLEATARLLVLVSLTACTSIKQAPDVASERRWLAGDHHIHSRYSVGWDTEQNPPAPIIGGDAIYPTPMNALMARHYGLSWMVTTDHGGPNHNKLNHDIAYPELVQSREVVDDLIQFYGMELNSPGGDHSSLIIPHTDDEAAILYRLESAVDKLEAFPPDPSRDTEDRMIAALETMRTLDKPPIVIANHPSRSARAYGEYGLYSPAELRRWNDTAPGIAVGMAGAPGHQAIALSTAPDITEDAQRVRGGYGRYPTMGGFDQMTAKLGGFWDSMLAEGRRWWITANSDSHVHYSEGGVDFWPGEYSKTYVHATKNHHSILAGLRAGRVFVTTGDLVSEVYVDVAVAEGKAAIGGEITTRRNGKVNVSIRLHDPAAANGAGHMPQVRRVDLILGDITGPSADPARNHNPSTRVERRFTADDWSRDGDILSMQHTFVTERPTYVRIRGTNTGELEPLPDPPAEDPWQDLWFYTNPVFVRMR